MMTSLSSCAGVVAGVVPVGFGVVTGGTVTIRPPAVVVVPTTLSVVVGLDPVVEGPGSDEK